MSATHFDDVDSGDTAAHVAYLDAATERFAERRRSRYSLLRLEPGAAVLDVGCGTGDGVIDLVTLVSPGGRVVGVDASAAMVAEARGRTAAASGVDVSVEIDQGDACALDFPNHTFHAARAERVLQHVADPARAVKEMSRVVRPGGRVVVLDPDHKMAGYDFPAGRVTEVIAQAPAQHLDLGRQLRRLFVEAGLADVEVIPSPLEIKDLATANIVLGPQRRLPEAVEAGLVTEGEVADWWDEVAARDKAGSLYGCLVAFAVSGTVPTR